jgi:hypothetical protein
MKITQAVFLFAMLGVTSARVGESVNASNQDETRILEERVRSIEIEFSVPTNPIATPGGGGGTLGGLKDSIRVMVGYKNERGKRNAKATDASELITEFKTVNVLTMTIPSALLDVLAKDPDIE